MRVGIVTFTTGDNFGQRLQNYALQQVLIDLEQTVYTIRKYDFRLGYKYIIKHSIYSIFNIDEGRSKFLRIKAFAKFNKKYIRYYRKIIRTRKESACLKTDFDLFVAGSDQIWSPYSGDVTPFYFLDFANDYQKISYAASISAPSLPVGLCGEYRKRLESFSSISVREYEGAEIISNLLSREIEVVLDPTLLLDVEEWIKIEKRPRNMNGNERFILKYNLGNYSESKLYEFAKKNEFDVIDILNPRSKYYTIGPCEFLYLIHNAEMVFTDSYHCIIFSLIFSKLFVYHNRQDDLGNMSSRFNTLFNIFGIDEIEVKKFPDQRKVNSILNAVESVINEKKIRSKAYLKEAIGKVQCLQ